MRSFLLAAAVAGVFGAASSADANGMYRTRSYRYRPYSTRGYTYNSEYSYGNNTATQSSRRGIFGAIMELERRKNEFLFGR
jgi:hypothetical protein